MHFIINKNNKKVINIFDANCLSLNFELRNCMHMRYLAQQFTATLSLSLSNTNTHISCFVVFLSVFVLPRKNTLPPLPSYVRPVPPVWPAHNALLCFLQMAAKSFVKIKFSLAL
jgi:hypothetical protein